MMMSQQRIVDAKEIDSKTDLQQEESFAAEHRTYLPPPGGTNSPQAAASNDNHELWPQSRSDMPQIKSLNVKCEKNFMKVNVEFDRPFYGTVFSKGHFSDPKCVHMIAGSGHLIANFDIFMGACGMTSMNSDTALAPTSSSGSGLYIENTIIIQYDPQVQEIWDQARRLRCTWYDYYEKAVTFKSFSVEMQDAVTANYLGDNIQCWLQIQVGKGPWASEVAGIVKIGQTMTIVLAIKDEENKFDMLVRNCIAHDGKRTPIDLVDSNGCIVRPKIMSKFSKIKNFGASASVLSYAYFQAFKFPDSMEVHFQCTIQVCRHQCPEQCSGGDAAEVYNTAPSQLYHAVVKPREEAPRRPRRDVQSATRPEFGEVGVNKIIQVVSSGDLDFNLASNETLNDEEEYYSMYRREADVICLSSVNFTVSALILTSILTATCLVAVFFFLKATQVKKTWFHARSWPSPCPQCQDSSPIDHSCRPWMAPSIRNGRKAIPLEPDHPGSHVALSCKKY